LASNILYTQGTVQPLKRHIKIGDANGVPEVLMPIDYLLIGPGIIDVIAGPLGMKTAVVPGIKINPGDVRMELPHPLEIYKDGPDRCLRGIDENSAFDCLHRTILSSVTKTTGKYRYSRFVFQRQIREMSGGGPFDRLRAGSWTQVYCCEFPISRGVGGEYTQGHFGLRDLRRDNVH
jgi:hypothetical protein